MVKRKTLATYPNSKKCIEKIDELNTSFKKMFNRNSKAELFYSNSGNEIKPIHQITAYYEDESVKEMEYFEILINKENNNKTNVNK